MHSFISSSRAQGDHFVSLGDIVLTNAWHDLGLPDFVVCESQLLFLRNPVRNVRALSLIDALLPIIGKWRRAVIFHNFIIRLCIFGLLDFVRDSSIFC